MKNRNKDMYLLEFIVENVTYVEYTKCKEYFGYSACKDLIFIGLETSCSKINSIY